MYTDFCFWSFSCCCSNIQHFLTFEDCVLGLLPRTTDSRQGTCLPPRVLLRCWLPARTASGEECQPWNSWTVCRETSQDNTSCMSTHNGQRVESASGLRHQCPLRCPLRCSSPCPVCLVEVDNTCVNVLPVITANTGPYNESIITRVYLLAI